jgi:alanine racemase
MTTHFRPTRAEIDLDAIRRNVGALGEHAPGAERLAVVKANAYGHGDVPVARAVLEAGATWLGVALVEEGIRLREAGIDAPILILVDPPREAAKAIVDRGLTASVYTKDSVDALDEAAQAAGTRIAVHVCVDTGMHREGVPLADLVDFVTYTARQGGVRVGGLWSHFAVADEEDEPFTAEQAARFAHACEQVAAAGFDIPLRHLANSAGAIALPRGHLEPVHLEPVHLEMVRMGIAMYGLYPAGWMRDLIELRPAMRLVSAVGIVRKVGAGEGVSYGLTYRPAADTTIVNVPIGYGDGFTRLLSNKAEVLIGGKRRPIAGRVTMDTIMVDCGTDDISAGDEVVLIGRQGDDEITADEIAAKLGTINYEVVCNVGPRVPRVYVP